MKVIEPGEGEVFRIVCAGKEPAPRGSDEEAGPLWRYELEAGTRAWTFYVSEGGRLERAVTDGGSTVLERAGHRSVSAADVADALE